MGEIDSDKNPLGFQPPESVESGPAWRASLSDEFLKSAQHFIFNCGQILYVRIMSNGLIQESNHTFREIFGLPLDHANLSLFDYLEPKSGALCGGYGQQEALPTVFVSKPSATEFLFHVYEDSVGYELFGFLQQPDKNIQSALLADLTTQMGKLVQEVKRSNRKLSEAHDHIRDIARTDELTGVATRRFLLQRLGEEISHARRYGHPLSLVSLDVDDFKSVNDEYGHLEGDNVLRQVGAVLNELSRTSDIPARQGGEEFCIVLPDTSLKEASYFAERVRQAIQNRKALGNKREVTASFGVAEYDAAESIDHFLNRADEALYKAKRAGKNQVCQPTI